MPSGRGVLDLVQKPRSSTQKHPPRFPNRLSWIDGRTVAVSRRSPGASGSGLGFSNGLKQAELENPASDTLCGDYNGNKKNFYCCGRAHFFQAEDRQEKIPGCRTSAGASATRGGGMPHHPETHCDSACGLYSTTLVLMPLDAHFARLKIGYAHRDKAKYPPYYAEGVQ